ncbi:MAG: DUF3369 domain-containing protein [Tissierellales bacterium]|jgi:CheY-like chemotaxis protein|nr:DUF3369 domain-containing protein [Tissierellales bacterium]
MNDDFLFFAEDEEDEILANEDNSNYWNILIVDDEETVHSVTKLVLEDVKFEDRGFNFISARNEKEARDYLESDLEISVILLDVVMEHDDSGLRIVDFIRNELDNRLTRIILRTGMPGHSPEREIISKYDINDYKTKVELTSEKLYTSMISSLRAYRDLKTISDTKKALKKIILASTKFFEYESLEQFSRGVLEQLTGLLYQSDAFIYINRYNQIETLSEQSIFIGTGVYESVDMSNPDAILTQEVKKILEEAVSTDHSYCSDDGFVKCYKNPHGLIDVIFFRGSESISETDKDLLELFTLNILAAYENILYKIK